MKPHEEFSIQIKKLGLKPENLHAVIMSHGHLDHCGALKIWQEPMYRFISRNWNLSIFRNR